MIMDIAYINWEYTPILLMIIVGIVFIVKLIKKSNKDTERLLVEIEKKHKETKINKYNKKGVSFISNYTLKCYGGISGFSGSSESYSLNIDVCNDRLVIETNINEKYIMAKDINYCKISTEKEIEEKISLGKLVVFGIWAFGMKKKQNIKENKYIEMGYLDERRQEKIALFEEKGNFRFLQDVKRIMKEYRVVDTDKVIATK